MILQHSSCPYKKIQSYFAKPKSLYLHVHYFLQETGTILWLSKLKNHLMTCLELAVGKWFLNIEVPYHISWYLNKYTTQGSIITNA